MRILSCASLLAFALAACGGGGGSGEAAPAATPPQAVASAEVTLLFMGNSHTSANNLTGMVTAMVRAAQPGRTVASAEAPGWMFLDERASDPASLALLGEHRWTYVVLQAQKYSSSGMFEYPTAGAESLVRKARAVNALPILFPEWPRAGEAETQRIYDLHVSIARKEPACVAPVGQAWDLSRARYPALVLHNADGNHSAPPGAFLAALVIANAMTGYAPDRLPYLAGFGVDEDSQARLRGIAAETIATYPPRQYCPQ